VVGVPIDVYKEWHFLFTCSDTFAVGCSFLGRMTCVNLVLWPQKRTKFMSLICLISEVRGWSAPAWALSSTKCVQEETTAMAMEF